MALTWAVGILGVGSATQIFKYVKRSYKDRKMRSSTPVIELGQQDQVYQILSCLVEGVYAADKGDENASDCWTKLGYEELDLEEQHYSTAELADVCKPCCQVRLMLFRRSRGDGVNCNELSQPLASGGKLQTPMPKYVVAIRGTITKCRDDLQADLLIWGEKLHTHKHYFKSVESLIHQMVAKFSVEDVWVAGHSLGAAIALIATRQLALKGKLLKTHLFHAPNFTVDVVAMKMLKSLAKGLGDTLGTVMPGTDPKCIRKAVGPVAGQVEEGWKNIAKATGSLVAPTYSKDMAEECDKLLRAKWTPHLYVNRKDFICSDFITHFKSKYQVTASSSPASSTLFSALAQRIARQGSRSNHLIPAAILYINNWGEGLREPHKLHQWYNYNVVNLEVLSYTSESYTYS